MIDDPRKGSVPEGAWAMFGKKNEQPSSCRSIDSVTPTITHELRSPLTSVRALSEILRDNPDIDIHRRQEFLGIIIKETERLTSAVNHMLDAPAFLDPA